MTAKERIRAAARENGWTPTRLGELQDRFTRRSIEARVNYTSRDAVNYASRSFPGTGSTARFVDRDKAGQIVRTLSA